MSQKAFEVFGKIHAEENLKQKTVSFLQEEAAGRMRRRYRAVRAASCCLLLALLFFCGGVFYRLYFTPVAYIDFDVNPSIEFCVNRFGRVIASHAYNDDGKEILEYVNVSHVNYAEAAKRLLDAMEQEGYFRPDTLLSVTVQTGESGREGSMLKSLQEIVAQESAGGVYDIPAEIYAVTEEVKHCAKEHQVSPAKYLAIEGLIEVDPEVDFETCKGHSVHELREMAKNGCVQDGSHHGWENEEDSQEIPEGHHDLWNDGDSQEMQGGHHGWEPGGREDGGHHRQNGRTEPKK